MPFAAKKLDETIAISVISVYNVSIKVSFAAKKLDGGKHGNQERQLS